MATRLRRELGYEDHFESRGLGEVLNAPIDMILGDPDWPELRIDLGALWR